MSLYEFSSISLLLGDKNYSQESLYSGWAIVACYIAFKFTNEIQKVYLFYGLFKSPLYSGCSATDELFIVLWQHIRAFTFNFLSGILLAYYVVGMVESWSEDQNRNVLIKCFCESWIFESWIVGFFFREKDVSFYINKQLHRHFLSILIIKHVEIKKIANFVKKKSRFVDSGFIKTCDELVIGCSKSLL